MTDLKQIRSNEDYEDALRLLSDLWGAKSGTPDGEKLDRLATLIDSYEALHFPIEAPSAEVSAAFRSEQQIGLGNTESGPFVFEILNDRNGDFAFSLIGSDNKPIFTSQVFSSKAEALAAIGRLKQSVSRSKIIERAA